MLKINDGTQIKRIAGKTGDRSPQMGVKRDRAVYVASGGETSLDISSLSPAISYMPGMNQLTIKRSTAGDLISGFNFFEKSPTSVGFSTPLSAGEWVEVIKEIQVVGVQAAALRPDLYSVTAYADQTLVIADFSWAYNLNPTKALGGCEVYLHGVLQTRGVDYNEVNLGTENTNQIEFIDALSGGENIIIKPTYQVIDQSAAASTFYGEQISGIQAAIASATQDFIGLSNTLTVPYTTVVGRAKIPDIANDLKVLFGIERLMIQGIYSIQNEYGPNTEQVYGAINDSAGLIRFVGSDWKTYNNTYGQAVTSTNPNDYVEVTFYGTGLNLLTAAANVERDFRVSVDGLPEGSNVYNHNSSLLASRGYSSNVVCPIVSGLDLGVHTVKIRLNSPAIDIPVHGFEFINESSDLSINSGLAYVNGLKYIAASGQSLAYNGAATGTKGGRSVVYLKSDGSLGQAFTAVSSSTAYLSSTDHTNEEVARTYFPREFGAGNSNDFSLIGSSASAAAFTLDDNTTCLVSSSAGFNAPSVGGGEGVFPAASNFIYITFVGTGLDIETNYNYDYGSATLYTVSVDGTSVGNLQTSTNRKWVIEKIVSGLPYGAHTVKISRDSGFYNKYIRKFTVYQPKKPAIPAGSVELCDYNVMANYSASGSVQNFSAGVLAKGPMRELAYFGTPSESLDSTKMFGWRISLVNQNTDSFEYTFFGTGIDLHLQSSASGASGKIYVDGSLHTGSASIVGSSCTWSSLTSTLSWSAAAANTVSISGLPLGLHSIKISKANADSANVVIEGIGVAVPVHSHKHNLYSDIQNTLSVGSNSLTDIRKTSMLKETPAATKAWSQAVSISSYGSSTTSGSYVPCQDLSCSIKTSGGPVQISYSISARNPSSGAYVYAKIYVDGAPVGLDKFFSSSGNVFNNLSDLFVVGLSPGFHKIDVYWNTSDGTATAFSRNLTVREI